MIFGFSETENSLRSLPWWQQGLGLHGSPPRAGPLRPTCSCLPSLAVTCLAPADTEFESPGLAVLGVARGTEGGKGRAAPLRGSDLLTRFTQLHAGHAEPAQDGESG